MPKRSTPFQALVRHIQEQLGEAAVDESVMLTHRLTGKKREVDVVVRGTVGEHDVTVSLECVEKSRPADVGWVEQMRTKHEHLDTDRLILVSLKGFSSQALTLAASLGIAAYAPEDALELDWTRVVGLERLHIARFGFTRETVWILIGDPAAPTEIEAGPDTCLQDGAGAPKGTVGSVVDLFLNSGEFSTRAMNRMDADGSATITTDFTLNDDVLAVDTLGRAHRVFGFRAKVAAVRKTAPIDLTSLSWKGTPAAFGRADTPLGDTTVTFVERQPGDVDARMSVDGEQINIRNAPDLENEAE